MCAQRTTIQPQKELNPVVFDSVVSIGERYIKWKKLGTERRVLLDFTPVETKNGDLMGMKTRIVVIRGWWQEEEGQAIQDCWVTGIWVLQECPVL